MIIKKKKSPYACIHSIAGQRLFSAPAGLVKAGVL
jgi:hypothetical protein